MSALILPTASRKYQFYDIFTELHCNLDRKLYKHKKKLQILNLCLNFLPEVKLRQGLVKVRQEYVCPPFDRQISGSVPAEGIKTKISL